MLKNNKQILLVALGGNALIRKGRSFSGVDAVIDKDLASAKLAEEVSVDIFLIATDVQGAALNYGTKNQKFLRSLTIREATRFLAQGHFPPGSMGPKIEAAIQFVQKSGKRAVVASIEHIKNAVKGKSGTEIVGS